MEGLFWATPWINHLTYSLSFHFNSDYEGIIIPINTMGKNTSSNYLVQSHHASK